MSLSELLKREAKDLLGMMKNNGIVVGKEENEWRTGFRAEPVTVNFLDKGTVDNFTGVLFAKTINGETVYFFNPPEEITSQLVHDDRHAKNEGYWVKYVPREITASRTLVETGISAPKSSSELRNWDSRRLSKYIISEAENYETVLVCIISQLENVGTVEAKTAINQLTELLLTVTGEKMVVEDDGDDGDISEKMQGLKVSPRAKNTPHPSKRNTPPPPPPPRAASPPRAAPPNGSEKMDKLIAKYKQRIEEKGDTGTIADAIKRLAKELSFDSDYMEENYDFYGFGRSRLQSNRRRKRMSRKRMSRKKYRNSTSSRSRKSFGSLIYGLQSGPKYQGVYPMHLKVNETFPNLNNVKRSYSLNEFGRTKSNGFGCGCNEDKD